jgi:hypothetical protein
LESQKTFSDRLNENSQNLFNLLKAIYNKDVDIKSAEYKMLEKQSSQEFKSLQKEFTNLKK